MPRFARTRSRPAALAAVASRPGRALPGAARPLRPPPDDPELESARAAAHREGPIAEILNQMNPAGYWVQPGAGYAPKYHGTVWSIIMLAQLGAWIEATTPRRHGLRVRPRSRAGARRAVQLQRHAFRDDRLPPRQPLLGPARAGLPRRPAGGGVRLAGPQRDGGRHRAEHGAQSLPPLLRLYLRPGLRVRRKQRPTMCVGGSQANAGRYEVAGRPADACVGPSDGTRRRLPARHRPGHGRLPDSVRRQAERRLVEVRLPRLLHHRPAAERGGAGRPRVRARPSHGARALQIIRDKQDAEGRWPLEYHYGTKTWVGFGRKGQPSPWVTLRALRVLKIVGENQPLT